MHFEKDVILAVSNYNENLDFNSYHLKCITEIVN